MSVVEVPRATLRSMRSLVGGIVVGVLLLLGAVVMMAVDAHGRCEAGNEFRREALPAAFDLYTRRLGTETSTPDDQVAEVRERVAADMDELFPPRDCSLL